MARPKRRRNREMDRRAEEYWRKLAETDGFDVEHLVRPNLVHGLIVCLDPCEEQSPLVCLYAKMGLHRYNMLEGKNFKFVAIKKYNYLTNLASTYYITLDATEGSSGLIQTFQVKVGEHSVGKFQLICHIARLQVKGDTKREEEEKKKEEEEDPPFLMFHFDRVNLPERPNNRSYEVKESELLQNDWLALYLKLAFCTTNRSVANSNLSSLKITEVLIETDDDEDEPLKAKSATFYITYKDMMDEERSTTVKRILNKGQLVLEGKIHLHDTEIASTFPGNTGSPSADLGSCKRSHFADKRP